MPLIVPYLPLNPLLPRPKGAKDAEGMKSKFLAVILRASGENPYLP